MADLSNWSGRGRCFHDVVSRSESERALTCLQDLQRHNKASVCIVLTWNQDHNLSNAAENSVFLGPSTIDSDCFDRSGTTFLGFRCKVCGKANSKTSWDDISCTHCSTPFSNKKDKPYKSTSRRRKMELSFTGSRSDLGRANLFLSDQGVTKRSVSTFRDGTRVSHVPFS